MVCLIAGRGGGGGLQRKIPVGVGGEGQSELPLGSTGVTQAYTGRGEGVTLGVTWCWYLVYYRALQQYSDIRGNNANELLVNICMPLLDIELSPR